MTMLKNSNKVGSAGFKRSIARRFNDVLSGDSSKTGKKDFRVERRLRRFRDELKNGETKTGQKLTPLDIASRINGLLQAGDRVTEIRRYFTPRPMEYDREMMVELLREMHPVYQYLPEAYRFAGVDNETLLEAEIIDKIPAKRGPKPGRQRKRNAPRS